MQWLQRRIGKCIGPSGARKAIFDTIQKDSNLEAKVEFLLLSSFSKIHADIKHISNIERSVRQSLLMDLFENINVVEDV